MRKKFTVTLLLFVAGTALAYVMKATLPEYTMFATLLLGTFGAADLVDKKMENKE